MQRQTAAAMVLTTVGCSGKITRPVTVATSLENRAVSS
jgi:hypothetical protein